jgi:hypothetical protein
MCLKDTIQGSVVDSFEIIQFKQVYLFKTQNRNSENKRKRKQNKKREKGRAAANWAAPGAQTGQQPSSRPKSAQTRSPLSLSLPGGTHLSAASSPPISLLLSLVSETADDYSPQ